MISLLDKFTFSRRSVFRIFSIILIFALFSFVICTVFRLFDESVHGSEFSLLFGEEYFPLGIFICVDITGNVLVSFTECISEDTCETTTESVLNKYEASLVKVNSHGSMEYIWSYETRISGLETDMFGNIYISGYFYSDSEIYPGLNDQDLISPDCNTYLVKLNPDSDIVWSKTWNSKDCFIAIGSDSNIYILSHMELRPELYFNPVRDTSINHSVKNNAYIICINFHGECEWVIGIPEIATNLSLSDNNEMFITGSFNGTVDFNPGPQKEERTATLFAQYMLKLNEGGEFAWVHTWPLSRLKPDNYLMFNECVVDSLGNVFTIGQFTGDIDFNPGIDIEIHSSLNGFGCFLIKINEDGIYQFVRTWDGRLIAPYDLVISRNDELYIVGEYQGSIDFNPGHGTIIRMAPLANDAFFLSLDANGQFLFVKTWGTLLETQSATVISIDSFENIYIAGKILETGYIAQFKAQDLQ